MNRSFRTISLAALVGLAAAAIATGMTVAAEQAVAIPPPAVDAAESGEVAVAVFAGGCFWGVQGVFQHTRGVINAVSGYSGGAPANPSYEQVSGGETGHAEAVEITYDPAAISYGRLLQIFFAVAHNPTQLDFQGPDRGTQYRSAIFTTSDEQKKAATAYVAQLDAARVYPAPIVTEIAPLAAFYAAENYHQDYATLHPDQPYIVWNDLPKIANLKAMFPDAWRATPKLVFAENAT